MLETNNRQLSDFLYIVPMITDPMGGQPLCVNLEQLDGKELEWEWKQANYRLLLEPGEHVIMATCEVRIDDMNRDVNDRSGKKIQHSTEYLTYTFEGGKKYRIFAQEYINGTCKMTIEPQ